MRGRIVLTCLLAATSLLAAAAQQPEPPATPAVPATPTGPATLTIQSQLVFVPTTVFTHSGELLYGLSAKQFVVEADGVPQTARMEESDLDARPLSLVVAVQCSRSAFREFPKLRGLTSMVENVIGAAPAEVAVVQFGSGEEALAGFTHDPSRWGAALNRLQPCEDSEADIYDAVEYATQLLETRKATGRRAVLLVSETRDHGSAAKAEAVIEQLNRANTVLDAVSFSPVKSQALAELSQKEPPSPAGLISLLIAAVEALRKNAPKELARQSGGEYTNFTTQKGFDRSLLALANHVHNYYLLSFQPRFHETAGGEPDPAHRGPLHGITVTVPDYPDARLRYRESYWTDAVGPSSPK